MTAITELQVEINIQICLNSVLKLIEAKRADKSLKDSVIANKLFSKHEGTAYILRFALELLSASALQTSPLFE